MADDKVARKENIDTTNNLENSSVECDLKSKNEADKALEEKDLQAANYKTEAGKAHERKDLKEENSKNEAGEAHEGKDLLEANSKNEAVKTHEGKDLLEVNSKNETAKDLAAYTKQQTEKVLEGKDLPAANAKNEADKACERSASTSAFSPDPKLKSLTNQRSEPSSADTNLRKSSSGVPGPTADEISDGEFSSLSTTSSSSDEKSVTERDSKSGGAKRACSIRHSTVQTSSTDLPRDKATARSFLNELNFSDFDDQSVLNVDLYRAILESLRDLQKPKEVDISKVVSRRPKRRRSNASDQGCENSPGRAECPRSPKRVQREASSIEPCRPTPLPSRESSKDTVESVPTESSRDVSPKAKQHKTEQTSTKKKGAVTISDSKFPERSTVKKSDCLGILKYDAASALKQQTSAASSSAPVKESPDSPPPPSKPKRRETSVPCPVPMQTAGNLIIADRSTNDPHARRINSLTSLVDRLVDFSNYMDSHPLLSVPGPAPRRLFTQGEFSLPGNYRTLHELQEAFRRGFLALQEDTSDSDDSEEEDEATKAFKKSVRDMRDHLRQLADGIAIYSESDQEETVPPSDDPVTIEGIRRFLPRLWQGLRYNNMLMNQWTATLLHWCLEQQPESRPQQFYDAETGIRALFGRIDDVRRSTARLLNRWRHRRMDSPELGDLTYLMTMASAAMSLYSTLESEVINARYAMGTRNRRRPREESDADEPVQSKKTRKDDSGPSKKG